ncbi:rubrerythrin-like protein 1 [Thermococcus cleftensis]|uniref:Rubrerythrin-like protein 1 n=1 Tax=Thermococcus cleftensis (strain DSM 27260 / KACC 17922 / CL1) TaxID=163003 RepID=I3ZS07_THECF|nr:ferritin family protein [Thermococcus cleftensis]AFL94491.1 rubrerythrin-like protein 1 [Thermococcus cleftensis]
MGAVRYREVEKTRFKKILKEIGKLNYKELMAYWMDQEVQEAEMYHKLYQMSREVNWDERVSKLFYELYKESLGHAEALLKMFKEMFPGEKPPKVNLPPLEVELSEERLKDLVYHGNLREILEYLMGTEKLAHDVYRHLAEKAEGEDAKATLLWLAKIENGHYTKLRSLYTVLFGESSEYSEDTD